MSRVARLPIPLPPKVEVAVKDGLVQVKGPLGELSLALPKNIQIQQEGDILRVVRMLESKALWGS